VPAPLVPDDDLYARLEVDGDASPEAIELAWRALLKQHHPDVAGDGAEALERAKRINVAHDWLADASLRARYDRERLGVHGGRSVRWHGPLRRQGRPSQTSRTARPAGAPEPVRSRSARPRTDLVRGDPAVRLARFLARVERLTPDELDRLAAAEPPPIAFLATVRRFLPPEARVSFAAAEAGLVARVPPERWAVAGLREGLLGVAAELVLAAFLDDALAEPFRGRARDRLLRAWEASIDQPRHGPNALVVAAVRDRVAAMTRPELAAFLRASQGVPGADRPWPAALDPEEDEALRISAELAARDVAAAIPVTDLPPAVAMRARRLAARLGHVVALRHAFPAATYASLVAPFASATGATGAGERQDPGPGVRRASR
jgi:curved DNA-binding protein CbpA